MIKKTYEYNGRHFIPHSKLKKGLEMSDLILKSEDIVGFFYDKNLKKYGLPNYTHDDFYKAMDDSEMDIFQCVENGKLYLPCDRELYVYEGEFQQEREN